MEKQAGSKWWHALVKPSTVDFLRESRKSDKYSLFDLLHGLFYARFPYLYIGVGTGEHRLAKIATALINVFARLRRRNPRPRAETPTGLAFANGYHGKVMPLQAVTELVRINQPIRIPDLEHVIPYDRARALILHNPDHIIAMDCPCRAARDNPCLPLDVCLIVGEPFAGFVYEHHPNRTRWVTPDQAVEILAAEEARGHVHHAFFKDAMLGRFFAICNCCACCCGAMHAHRSHTPMLASSGYVAQVDSERCKGCGACVKFCQFEALSLLDGGLRVDEAACMGCGICGSHCTRGALSLRREPARGEPLEITTLLDAAAGN